MREKTESNINYFDQNNSTLMTVLFIWPERILTLIDLYIQKSKKAVMTSIVLAHRHTLFLKIHCLSYVFLLHHTTDQKFTCSRVRKNILIE